VIGAGPAGALSALQLAKYNFKVLLVDKSTFPRSKVCGCCLNQDAVHSLEEAGLLGLSVFQCAPVLDCFNLYTKYGRASVPLPAGLAISRKALDSTIIEAAISQGCAFLSGTTARVGAALPDHRVVQLRHDGKERSVTARYVIVGEGIAGTSLKGLTEFAPLVAPASRIGIGALIPNRIRELRPGEIRMYCSQAGYLGMTQIENGMVDTAAAIDRSALNEQGSASAVVHNIMISCNETPPTELLTAQWHGTNSLTQMRRVPAHNRVFLVGDAAGYTEPFTGQGIAWAFRCALLIAPVIEQALNGTISDPEQHWSKIYENKIRKHQRASSLIAMLLRYESAFSVGVLALSLFPNTLKLLPEYLNRSSNNYQPS
jgi:menaquinone-9 beta-reductase